MTDRITLLIKAKNLSAAQFADEIGVQRSSISHLMSGRNKPSLDLIQKTLQRFPEVSSEWLLFGKGEMVRTGKGETMRELNLFDSQMRSGGNETGEKLVYNADPVPAYKDQAPSLFAPENQRIYPEIAEPSEIAASKEKKPEIQNIAEPSHNLKENIKISEIRNESGRDSDQVQNAKSNKKECAINQIIVFYEDRTFIAYSPGN